VSIGVLSFFIPLGKACLFAAILGGIEFFSPYGFDNITVPLAYAFLVQLFF
jgi:dolichol kinase